MTNSYRSAVCARSLSNSAAAPGGAPVALAARHPHRRTQKAAADTEPCRPDTLFRHAVERSQNQLPPPPRSSAPSLDTSTCSAPPWPPPPCLQARYSPAPVSWVSRSAPATAPLSSWSLRYAGSAPRRPRPRRRRHENNPFAPRTFSGLKRPGIWRPAPQDPRSTDQG
jgi:hypothetical protein